MSYFGELHRHWRSLTAASLGLTVGYVLINYVGNVFTPHLLKEFGWQRSDLAMIGMTALIGIIGQPLAGRLTDRFGVRRVALVGVIAGPLLYLALSRMGGALWLYYLICTLHVTIFGATTATVVYSRLIAQRFDKARGLALALSACCPPGFAALVVPFLSGFIDAHGWRAGYVALAAFTAIGGVVALALTPPHQEPSNAQEIEVKKQAIPYRKIFRHPAFMLLMVGVLLCNLSWTFQTTQLKVMILDKGLADGFGSLAISIFAASVIVGRLLCGLLLDRFPTYLVAAIFMGLPGIGLTLLGTDLNQTVVVGFAVLLMGLALGAEGDVLAYVVMHYFPVSIYSSVLGLVMSALALSVAGGSLLLGVLLKLTAGFPAFLFAAGACALVGGYLFLRLRKIPSAA